MLDSLEAGPPPLEPPAPLSGPHVLRSATLLACATVLVKLAAFFKDLLVARSFGAGDELDAFLIAFLVPSFGVTVLASSFAPAFMPSYIKLGQRQGPSAARRLATSALLLSSGAFIVCSLLLVALGPWILPWLALGFDAAKLALAQSLLYVVAGILVASGISAVFSTLLCAHEHFGLPAIAPLAVPLGTMVVLWSSASRIGIQALAAGMLFGFVLEAAVLGIGVVRRGLVSWPSWHGLDAPLRHVISRYLPLAVASLMMSSSMVVDQSMAASLGSGNVSVLNYGSKVVSLVLGIVAVSLTTALLPRFSRTIAAGQWSTLKQSFRLTWLAILAGTIPWAVVVAIFAEPMIRLFFERGAFTSDATLAASHVQMWLAIEIPFYVLVMVGFRLLNALDGNGIILRIGALNLVLNVAGDLVLMHWFGVTGIAMSTSLVYIVAAGMTLVAVKLKMAEAMAGSQA